MRNPTVHSVAGVEGDIGRLESLIADLREQLTTQSGSQGSLASISAQLRMAEVDLETRTMMMQESLQSMEAARIESHAPSAVFVDWRGANSTRRAHVPESFRKHADHIANNVCNLSFGVINVGGLARTSLELSLVQSGVEFRFAGSCAVGYL